eukprot:SAG31_NODE_44582_length_262_cov_0.638037_1_plen_87_part_11
MAMTSANLGLSHGHLPMGLLDAGVLASNPDLRWSDVHSKGYMTVHLTHDRQQVRFIAVPVDKPLSELPMKEAQARCLAAFEVNSDEK